MLPAQRSTRSHLPWRSEHAVFFARRVERESARRESIGVAVYPQSGTMIEALLRTGRR